jgi:protein disulfide-isomerase-like protein
MKLFLLFALISTTQATVYLTTDTFEEQTAGKKALVAFKSPWCGHCKKLKPEWDKLADAVDVVIAEVDCTKEQSLCQKHGVQGYPTIKYSDGFGWKNYEKGRDYASLESFVTDSLQDTCFDDPKLCSEEELQQIEEAKGLSSSDLDTRKERIKGGLEMTETLFKTQVEELQKQYKKLSEEKTIKVESLTKELSYLLYVKSKDEL